ncbi:MAG: exodeoxyribonuclease VII small subunit [Clostridia bacterium]|nr:exodeoxyribonuclease VII small subunit [Clostridia bacterium]
MEKNSIESMKYEQAYARLEQIVESMSGASVPLDELMDLYEEGMALYARCETLLKGYEARLEKVSKSVLESEEKGEGEEVPF